jgi:ubiquinone/menaquinone biosynthesis C-methylase UbiE
MSATPGTNDEQATLWNGTGGRAWVEAQALLDQTFQPLADLLATAVATSSARHVLDVGCGTGATALAAARRLPAGGDCVGIDISEPMIAAAVTRADRAGASVRFICADAQRYMFEPATFDMVISRFGVMFFDDPVRAFSNLRRSARDGAGLRLIAWRSPEENPFMTAAERAAAPLLPTLPSRKQEGPGQFAFADKAWVRAMLHDSGWTDIDIEPIDVMCAFPRAGLEMYLTRLGPVGRILQETDEPTRERVMAAVRPAFHSYLHEDDVRFVAACWTISGRAAPQSTLID